MNRLDVLLLPFLLAIGLPGQAHPPKATWLKAGSAQAIITPPLGTALVEPQGARATAVHDDLYVKALVLSDSITSVVIVSYDLVGMDLELSTAIRKAIAARTGIATDQIMLACTHAHNTPITVNIGNDLNKRNRNWEAQLTTTTVATVEKAYQNLQPASLAVGAEPVQIGVNRRLMMFSRARMMPNPHGPVIKETRVVRIDHGADPAAVLFSYPAHPVAVHAQSTEFTADFPAFAAQAIQAELGNQVLPIFVQGCAGDINVHPLGGGYEAATQVGQVLGQAVSKATRQARKLPPGPVTAYSERFYLPYRPVTPEVSARIVQRVEEGLRTLEENKADSASIWDQKDVLHWAKQVQTIAQNPKTHPGLPFEMQVFAFGRELAIIACTHELFVEYQLFMQANSPFRHTLVLAYTNGSASYIPTADAFYLNGYEVNGAQHRYGQPYLTPESEELIKKAALRVLNKVYRK